MNQEEYLKNLEEQRQAEAVKEAALFNFMTREARERFRRVEMAHPDNAHKALMIILQEIQKGKVKQVNDETLKKLLSLLNQKKDYKIIRK